MTKNNLQNKNIESEQQHFGLRKLSVGVASVLLSTTIFFGVNAAVSSVSNVVNADVVVDKSSDPMSVMTANQFGLDSNVSSFSYLGHSTTKNDNGQTQDVYKFVDHNDNISNDRIFKIYGIQGLDSGKLTITYQPSNKNGIPLSGSKSTTAGFNAGKTAQNVGNEIPVRLKESDLGWTHDILVTVSMTRAQEQNPAIIGGIAGASNRSTATAFDLSNAVKVASPKAHTTYSPDTRVEIDNRTDAEKTDPKVPEKTGVDDVKHLTDTEKDQVKQKVEEANKGNFPEGTTVTVADDGTATISYPDKSTDTIPGGQLVQQKTDADKIDPKVPEKTNVEDTQHLTDAEKDQVKQKVEEANKGNFPEGTTVTVADDGTATISYPDKSTDTIPGDQLVRQKTDADKIDPKVPEKTGVEDTQHLTDAEKDQVKQKVEEANKGNFPEGTTVTIGDDGTATITYPDGSKDTIPGGQLVQQKTDNKTTIADTDGKNAEIWQQQYYQGQKVDPLTVNDIVPGTVDITKVADVKWDVLPDTNRALQVIPPYDDASAIITFTDGSTKKVNVEYTVYFNNQEDRDNEKPSDGSKITDKVTPVVPEKTGVKDVKKLTQSEKDEVAEKIRKANDVVIPYDTDITIADDGTATLTYSDKSTDTIPGDQLVYQLDNSSDNNKGDNTGNQGGNNSGDNKGDNTGNQGGNNSGDNKGDNTGNQGGNNSGDNKGGNTQNDAEKITPNVPAKTGVADTTKLTDAEKAEVAQKVEEANKDNFPAGTTVTVANDGTATINYPDGSKDTIFGDQLVYQLDNSSDNNGKGGNNSGDQGNQGGSNSGDQGNQGGNNSGDQGNQGGNNSGDQGNQGGSNSGDQGNQGGNNSGDQGNQGGNNSGDQGNQGGNNSGDQGNQGGNNSGDQGNQGGNNSGDQGNQGSNTGNNAGNDQTDADKITPSVPGKTGVNDPEHLTDAEKGEVAQQIEDANKDNFPAGTTVTVADDGTATITYPDGSVDTIPGGELVYQNADANNANGQSGASNGAAVATIANTSADKNANKKSNADSKKLPQTGNDGSELTVLGSMMAMATLAFGAIKKRKN